MNRTSLLIKRGIFSKRYLWFLLSALAAPVFTMIVIETIRVMQTSFPPDFFEAFRMGENYNFGILILDSIDSIDRLTPDDFLKFSICATVIQSLITATVISFINVEAESGFIKLAIAKGRSRTGIFVNYLISAAVLTLPLLAASVLSTACICTLSGYRNFADLGSVFGVLAAQVIMQLCLAICTAVLALLVQKGRVLVFAVLGVLFLPTLVQYVTLFSGGSFQLSKLVFTCCLINSAHAGSSELIFGVITAIVTALIFAASGSVLFNRKDY